MAGLQGTSVMPLRSELISADRVAAEMLTPYPPGIPRQRIEEAHVAHLRLGQQAGLRDPDMTSLRVVA